MTPASGVIVRAADSSMCGRLAALHGASFSDEVWDAAALAQLIAGAGVSALAAFDADGSVNGFILVRVAADEAEILTLAVLPARRREGIATALVEAAVRHVAVAGAQSLFLEVARDNPPARALYGALGFAEVGLRRGYYERKGHPPADALVLQLVLGV